MEAKTSDNYGRTFRCWRDLPQISGTQGKTLETTVGVCVCVLRTPNQKWRGLFVTSNIFRNRLPCKNLKFWRPNIEITIRHLMCGLIEITCLEWWKSQKQSECSVLQFLLGSLSTRSLRVCDTEQEWSQGRSCFFFFFFWWLCVSARFICLCLIFLSSGWTSVEGSAVMDGAKLRGRSGAPSVSSLGNKTVFMWTQQLTHTHTHTPYQSGQSKVFKVFLVWCSHGTRQ